MIRRLSLCIRYWSYCNNNCSFCFEKNKSFDDMFRMPSEHAIDANNKCVRSLVDFDKYNYYTFKILGGELFAYQDDKIQKKLADSIDYFCNVFEQSGMTKKIEENQHVPETLVIASNLLYRSHDMLHSCLDVLKSKPYKTKASMMVSYDLYGRFNKPGLASLYYQNYIDIFNKYSGVVKPVVSFILSKQNIVALASRKKTEELEIFDALYDMNAPFDMTLLLNDCHVSEFAYSQRQLDMFIDIMLERYPRFASVFKTTAKNTRFKNATTRLTVQSGNVVKEETLFSKCNKQSCILCQEYVHCKHSLSDISYNAYDCDVKHILQRCENS